jgi:hypothetical protein
MVAVTTPVPEDTVERCTDGVDNDGNGFIDCNDFSCSSNQGFPQGASLCADKKEDSFAKCSDGKDNDANGYVDCGDFSCSGHIDEKVTEYCANVLENTFDKCNDGKDNDNNGYVDCDDYSCRNAKSFEVRLACQESVAADCGDDLSVACAGSDQQCSDGIDQDLDGFTDCNDWDCAWNPQVTVCAGKPKVCQ